MPGLVHTVLLPTGRLLVEDQTSTIVVWGDELCVGPVSSGVDFVGLRRLRAAYWGGVRAKIAPAADPLLVAKLKARAVKPAGWTRPEDALHELLDAQEVILWLGEGLVAQLAMLQCLDLIPEKVRVSLIPINLPDIHAGSKLAFATRRDLESMDRDYASRLWMAFRDPSPDHFLDVLAGAPALFGELKRRSPEWEESFPSTRNGLDRLQAKLLQFVQCQPMTASELVSKSLEGTMDGDLHVYDVVIRELQNKSPLLECHGAPDDLSINSLIGRTVRLSEFGQKVLNGEADAIDLNGVDKWVGGCHIDSAKPSGYRWNKGEKRFQKL